MPGLTRALLDASVAAYLNNVGLLLFDLERSAFSSRLEAYFRLYTGQSSSFQPLDELLLLAITAAGIAFLNLDQHVRFSLQREVRRVFKQMIGTGERLAAAQLDGFEACYIMSMLDEEDNNVVQFLDGQGPSLASQLSISPTSAEGLAKMAVILGLNRRAVAQTPRARRLFWAAYHADAFRAVAHQRAPHLGDDDHDHLMPKFPVSTIVTRCAYAIVDLSLLARAMYKRMTSQRVHGSGILVDDAVWVLDRLEKVQVEEGLAFEAQSTFADRFRTLHLEMLRHSLVQAAWQVLQAVGLLLTPHRLSAQDARSDKGAGAALYARADNLIHQSFDRLTTLVPLAAAHGVLRANPSMFGGTSLSYGFWACQHFDQANEHVWRAKIDSICSAVETCDSSRHAAYAASLLRKAVEEAAQVVTLRKPNDSVGMEESVEKDWAPLESSSANPSPPMVGVDTAGIASGDWLGAFEQLCGTLVWPLDGSGSETSQTQW